MRQDWGLSLTAVALVGTVCAVVPPVALPAGVDAVPTGALELEGRAGPGGRGPAAAQRDRLIGAVAAVAVAVTGPDVGQAPAVAALEASGLAGEGGAGGLVAAVLAVGVSVAHEALGDAVPIGAQELVLPTGFWA